MQFQEFMGQVQNKARLPSQGETARAISATLETLGERLTEDEAQNLAAQLPAGIGDYLRLPRTNSDRFSLDEFFQRVADQEGAGVDMPQAVHHARSVCAVLQDAASRGEIDNVRAQLPNEFNPLFDSGSEGQL